MTISENNFGHPPWGICKDSMTNFSEDHITKMYYRTKDRNRLRDPTETTMNWKCLWPKTGKCYREETEEDNEWRM